MDSHDRPEEEGSEGLSTLAIILWIVAAYLAVVYGLAWLGLA